MRAVNRREIIALLFRERLKIAVAFLLPVMVAWAQYVGAPRTYEAESKILIRPGREVEPRSDVGQPVNSALQATQQQVLNSEMELVSGREIAVTVLKEFGASTLFPGLPADRSPDLPPSDAAVNAFYGSLAVEPIRNSAIFRIRYQAPDPRLATKVLSRVLELYQKKHVDAYAHPISNFLGAQLAELEKKLESYDTKTTEFKVAHNIYDTSEERHLLLGTRSSLSVAIAQARSHLAELTKRIAVFTELRQQTPEEIKLYSETAPSDAIERARAELLSLRLQEQRETSGYMDGDRTAFPMIKLRNQIETVNNFLAIEGAKPSGRVRMGRNPLYDEITAEIDRAQAQIAPEDARVAALQNEIDRIEARLSSIEEAAQTLDVLHRQRENLQTALNSFRLQQAQAGLLEEMDKQRIVNAQIVEEPAPLSVDKPAHPTSRIYMLSGLAGGIVLASLAVTFGFLTHKSYLTPEEVEGCVKLPVLATVPMPRRSTRT